MKLIKFQFEHLELFDWREEEKKLYNVGSEFVMSLLQVEKGECFTAMHDGRIIVIGGIIPVTKKTGHAFTIFSAHADKAPVSAAKMVRRQFLRMFEDMGLHRVVTYNLADAVKHHRWCEWLGFQREDRDGIHMFDDDGKTYFQYGLVKNGC